MAIATLADLRARQDAPQEILRVVKSINSSGSSFFASGWQNFPFPGAIPTTAVVPTRATTGCFGQQNGGSNALRLVRAFVHSSTAAGGQNLTAFLIDRLSHQGGLDATVTSAQTTNLPTAALTRETTGEGVMMALEIYTTIGTTGTTATVSYTNQAGTAGRTSPAVVFGGTGFREGNRFIILPLQAGDSGVRSVESVTLVASTTTAGNFGVTLFKPVLPMSFSEGLDRLLDVDPLLSLGGFLPEIVDDACLHLLFRTLSASPGPFLADLRFAED